MYNDELVNMIVRQHNVKKITIKRLKIHSIHKDIIRLKQENRNIGAKITSLYRNLDVNVRKPVGESKTAGYTYGDRVMRDFRTIEYLDKLQKVHSRLINKHWSKVKALRGELGLLNGTD